MNRDERRAECKKRTLKHYRKTVSNIRKVVLKDRDDAVDTLLLLRSVLPLESTHKAHHFNGGVIYINEEMFSRLSVTGQVKVLVKYAIKCAVWMENRLPDFRRSGGQSTKKAFLHTCFNTPKYHIVDIESTVNGALEYKYGKR